MKKILALLALFLFCSLSGAQAQLELQVKAALLVSFTNLVTWTTPPATFSIGIIGADPFGPALENVAKLKNIPIKKIDSPTAIDGVDILYVAADQAANLAAITAAAKPGVLLVGEGDEFVAGGGHVAYVLRDGKVRFKLNPGAAEPKGLKFSPRLSSLAVP